MVEHYKVIRLSVEMSVFRLEEWQGKKVVHPLRVVFAKKKPRPNSWRTECYGIKANIIVPDHWRKGEVYQRDTEKQKVSVSG